MKQVIMMLFLASLITACHTHHRHDHHGPGNSENAPGHNKHGDGPGNSENAPGHNK